MSRGDKRAYTDKQKRKAEHIEETYLERGLPEAKAEEIAWATVNKQDGGGRRSAAARKGWETRRARSGQSATKNKGA
jgi:plasmid stabilization system protein ParE